MKAAVLHALGKCPRYEDFPDPRPAADEVLIHVKAVALENIDKAMAAGTHFAHRQFLSRLPAVVGFDGIGALADGRLVGFGGMKPPYGAMADLVVTARTVPVPEGMDAVTAAAVPASTLTSLIPLKLGARLQSGETVLVNGATGVSGGVAVQVARLLGAGRVIGTGRNPESMKRVLGLGADAVINLEQDDGALRADFRKNAGGGYDVVLDFLWGRPTEVLLSTLVPEELRFAKPVRLVQIGEKAGPLLHLTADSIRTSGLEIFGGASRLDPAGMESCVKTAYEWIREGKVSMEIEQIPLKDIESAWERDDFHGRRIVIIP